MYNVKSSGSSKRCCATQQVSFEHESPGWQHLPSHSIWCQGPFYRRDVAVYGSALHKHMRSKPCWWAWGGGSRDCWVQYVRLVRSGSALLPAWQLHISCHPTSSRQVTWSSVSCLNLLKKNVVFCIFASSSWWKTEEEGYRSLCHTINLFSEVLFVWTFPVPVPAPAQSFPCCNCNVLTWFTVLVKQWWTRPVYVEPPPSTKEMNCSKDHCS